MPEIDKECFESGDDEAEAEDGRQPGMEREAKLIEEQESVWENRTWPSDEEREKAFMRTIESVLAETGEE